MEMGLGRDVFRRLSVSVAVCGLSSLCLSCAGGCSSSSSNSVQEVARKIIKRHILSSLLSVYR